jgi:hypothetical protein
MGDNKVMEKQDYAFVVACNPGYSFGLISSMNAQDYFGTHADWEIVYEGFDQEYMDKVSSAFPFSVNWTHINDILPMFPNRRTDGTIVEKWWIANWILAYKLLSEKKYKVVCLVQADQFTFVNLDLFFMMGEEGFIVSGEYAFNHEYFEKHFIGKFGDDKNIWDRSNCALFDGVNFFNQSYTDLVRDVALFETEDSFRGEANHQVIAVNRAILKHGRPWKVANLNGDTWSCDSIWGFTSMNLSDDGDRMYNDKGQRIFSIHNRWWHDGRASAEYKSLKHGIDRGMTVTPEVIKSLERQEHNYNLVKSFMERFNNMRPEIMSNNYVKGYMRRPKYELGES